MPFRSRDPETERLAREPARSAGMGLTEAVRTALRHELQRAVPLRERVRPIQADFAALPDTGLTADKAFHDALSGEE